MRFRVLVADCPWRFDDKLPGDSRGADKHYETLSVKALCAFPLPDLYLDSVLFFWRVSSMQREALSVIAAWDFEVKTEIVWRKLTTKGNRFFGMGRITRAEHETCLIAVSGKPVVLDHSIRSTFDAPVGRHSEKPEAFYQIVERLYAGPRCELFARKRRPGWTSFGDQLTETES